MNEPLRVFGDLYQWFRVEHNCHGSYDGTATQRTEHFISAAEFDALSDGRKGQFMGICSYPTREAALADLAAAKRRTGK